MPVWIIAGVAVTATLFVHYYDPVKNSCPVPDAPFLEPLDKDRYAAMVFSEEDQTMKGAYYKSCFVQVTPDVSPLELLRFLATDPEKVVKVGFSRIPQRHTQEPYENTLAPFDRENFRSWFKEEYVPLLLAYSYSLQRAANFDVGIVIPGVESTVGMEALALVSGLRTGTYPPDAARRQEYLRKGQQALAEETLAWWNEKQ